MRLRWYRLGIEVGRGKGLKILIHFWRWTWQLG